MDQSVVSYPSPPASRAGSQSRTRTTETDAAADHTPTSSSKGGADGGSTLSARLDALLESYLELLDTYTTLRAQLSKDFSSGFLALAQANRTSTLGPGRRYGEEGFDGRMKALKTVQIVSNGDLSVAAERKGCLRGPEREREHEHEDNEHFQSISIGDTETTTTTPVENTQKNQTRGLSGLRHQTRPASSLSHLPSHRPRSTATCASAFGSSPTSIYNYNYTITSTTASIRNDDANADADPPLKSQFQSRDPLKWYGILNPPHLRQSQSHFTTSITATIPNLLSTMSYMAVLEDHIWDLRRELGIRDEYPDIQHQSQSPNDGSAPDESVDLDISTPSRAAKSLGILPTSGSGRRRHEQKHTTCSAKASNTKSTPPSPTATGAPAAMLPSGLSMRPAHPAQP
ncbi:uncharacterized protein A1O9_12783 [Exophiala aquamarina CBS 119918]|uniref:Vacuolar ATPase assembly protein VMA22 n=1 Tax=Exophiala aquamarina CBS 119918 TaxID=1182545 RepID=A0A072NTG2_9EURO|nr:uncharacterized protein A1O9_12783 [Exophiala aquamarina CBS 119918]KEF51169.1 hypothetical protein A1O9_12783 [Exophiala aquamarina CBS 119918]